VSREATAREWWIAAGAVTVVALAARLIVEPLPANWYTDAMGGAPRFGVGASALIDALRTLGATSDVALFRAYAVIGACAPALLLSILHSRAVSFRVAAISAASLALWPLHIRLSASSSEHVLSSTLTLLALAAWLRGGALCGIAILAACGAAATRVDAWPLLGAIPFWDLLRDKDERRNDGAKVAAIVFWALWIVMGVILVNGVVLPSHEPMPSIAARAANAAGFVLALGVLAFRPPFWLGPAVFVLANVGAVSLARRRPRLAITMLAWLLVAPLAIARAPVDSINVRYYVAVLPIVLIACAEGIDRVVRRSRRQAVPILVAAGALTLVSSWIAFSFRYTFQDEYVFLRHALASVPSSCTVAQLPVRDQRFGRDLDCCLDAPRSTLTLAFPSLSFVTIPEGKLPDADCIAYYETAACSMRDTDEVEKRYRPALVYLRETCPRLSGEGGLGELATAKVAPHAIGDLFSGGPAPTVTLRLRDATGQR
jgi:hypothetical protein